MDDRYVTKKDLDALQAQWDLERKLREGERQKQAEKKAKRQAIREKIRSRPTSQEPEQPELDPDAMFDGEQELGEIKDDWPDMVTGRQRKRRSKVAFALSPESSDPDRQPIIREIEGLGRFQCGYFPDDDDGNPFLTYGG